MILLYFAFLIAHNPSQKETIPLASYLLKIIPAVNHDYQRRKKEQCDGCGEELEGMHQGIGEERVALGMCPNQTKQVRKL